MIDSQQLFFWIDAGKVKYGMQVGFWLFGRPNLFIKK